MPLAGCNAGKAWGGALLLLPSLLDGELQQKHAACLSLQF
ncbi:hypothetical protein B398_05050 [Xylella fastidiosa 32]|nr:hypothetical protein B398_05050 [Xylella fastidiosa 32]